jgi:hypothetical protein
MNDTDRRRVTLAALFTVVALPAMWVFGGSDTSTAPSTGAAGIDVGANGAASAPATEYTPELPVFLDGPAAVVQPGVVDIAIPPAPGDRQASGRASFVRYADPSIRPCTTLLAPERTVLTVVNVDNGQSTTCTNILGVRLPAGVDLVIHTDVFAEISDLADAPVTVRISW